MYQLRETYSSHRSNKMRKYKVAIALRKINTKSGLGTIVYNQIQYFLDNNIEVDIYANKVDETLKKLNVQIIKLFKIPLLSEYLQRKWFSILFDIKSKQNSYDMIIGHGDIINQDVLFLHNLDEKAYFEIHKEKADPKNGLVKIRREILKSLKFKVLIANSELMKSELVDSFAIPAEKIHIVYPGYDSERFNINLIEKKRQENRKKLKIDQSSTVVSFITSGDFKNRNLDLLLDVLRAVKIDKIEFKLLLVSKEKALFQYKNKIAKYELEDNLIVVPLSHNVEQYYYCTDLLIHPAHIETFGMVIQEAMACGVAVITSYQVGASEIIPYKNYIMSKPNENELYKYTKELILNKDLRDELGKLSSSAVIKNSWNNYMLNSFENIKEKI